MKIWISITAVFIYSLNAQNVLPGARNAALWPFTQNSIWNIPIGDQAIYEHAQITQQRVYTDEDRIALTPNAPMTQIRYSDAGWSKRDRCVVTGGVIDEVPIPHDWVVSNGLPGTPNSGAVHLMPDSRTIKQNQPFARCAPGSTPTTLVAPSSWTQDIYTSDGIRGCHGGSGMSCLGGAIRVGELQSPDPIRHALKLVINMRLFSYRCPNQNDCFRWPALVADGGANSYYGTTRSGNSTQMRMGSLLALPKTTNINSLGLITNEGKKLAWTLQNYGAYIVDDSYWDAYGFVYEDGYHGDARTESQYYPNGTRGANPMVDDIIILMSNLYVVVNNVVATPGGPGNRLQPLAPVLTANTCLPGSNCKAYVPDETVISSSQMPVSSSSPISSSSIATSSSSSVQTGTSLTIEAESANQLSGLVNNGTALGNSTVGSYAVFNNIDFGTGVSTVAISYGVPAVNAGNKLELRIGSISGTLVASLTTQSSGDWGVYRTDIAQVSGLSGVQDLYLVYAGGGGTNWVADVDKLVFEKEGPTTSLNFPRLSHQQKSGVKLYADPQQGVYLKVPGYGAYNLKGNRIHN
jgi:hypothetical protein